ncbi:hypothetical protein HanIR_Chr08g0348551 [Helianthus annuus]|nr:hypothetical protein HanIR_Chr08g0348551 [Helianthus annuus]
MPTQHQTPIIFLHSIPITTRKQRQQHTRLLIRIRTQMNRLKPSRVKQTLPLSQRHMPLNPIRPFTRHHITNLLPQIHLRHSLILFARTTFKRVKHTTLERVEKRRIIMQRLRKPL